MILISFTLFLLFVITVKARDLIKFLRRLTRRRLFLDSTKCATLNNFPSTLSVEETTFENWFRDIKVPKIFVTEARTAADVVDIANWAKTNGFIVRPSGNQLSWSPITVTNNLKNIILVKTRPHLTKIEIISDDKGKVVKAGAGATLEEILEALENEGLGFGSFSSLGQSTIGGYLATGGHGTGVKNGPKVFGISASSLSNMVTSMQVVVWNKISSEFVLETISRSDSRMPALLANLGRIMMTEVTLRAGKLQHFRCQSITDVKVSDLFAEQTTSGATTNNSLADFVRRTGYVGILHFPFTSSAWIRIWTNSPIKPPESRETKKSYNYSFQEGTFPNLVATLLERNSPITPFFSQVAFATVRVALSATRTKDIWGTSKNVFLVVTDKAPKVSVSGFAILTSDKNLQKRAHEVFSIFEKHLLAYQKRGEYPISAPIEFRITSTDQAEDSGVVGALPPIYTATSPRKSNSEFNIVIWVDITTFSKTKLVPKFIFDVQSDFIDKFDGNYALVRPEWSKLFGCSKTEPWKNSEVISEYPEIFDDWRKGEATFSEMDPHKVFWSPLLDDILQ